MGLVGPQGPHLTDGRGAWGRGGRAEALLVVVGELNGTHAGVAARQNPAVLYGAGGGCGEGGGVSELIQKGGGQMSFVRRANNIIK